MRACVGAGRWAGLAGAAALLAGCEEPAWLTERDPLPPLPAWAQPLMGQPLTSAFAVAPGEACLGSVDVVEQRYGGAHPGAEISGWGWDAAAKAPFARIVVVDPGGRIAGAGEGGRERLDVPDVRKDVTSKLTGWVALTTQREGVVLGYGVLPDGTRVCPLGRIEL